MTKEAMLPKASTYLPKIGTTFKDSKGTKVSLFGQKDGLVLNIGGKEAFFGDGDAKKLRVFIDHLMMASNYFLERVNNVDSLIDAVIEGKEPSEVLRLTEARAYDSEYLQTGLVNYADDEDDPNLKGLLLYLKDRLYQSYPDGDVPMLVLVKLAKEPDARQYTRNIRNVPAEIKMFWSAL